MSFTKKMVFYWPYLVLPVIVPIVLYDIYYGGRSWQDIEITKILPFLIIFNLPHILYSFYPLIRKEVRKEVEKKSIIGLVLIVIASVIGVTYFTEGWTSIIILVTAYHVARQQIGILMLSLDLRSEQVVQRLKTWTHIFVALEILTYITAYTHTTMQLYALTGAILAFGAHTYILTKHELKISSEDTQKLFWVYASLFINIFFIAVGYSFAAYFIKRFLHDLQAFTLYILRDLSLDNLTLTRSNLLRMSVYPISAIILCNAILNDYYTAGTIFLSIMAMSHYYLESYFWKRGTLSVKHFKHAIANI